MSARKTAPIKPTPVKLSPEASQLFLNLVNEKAMCERHLTAIVLGSGISGDYQWKAEAGIVELSKATIEEGQKEGRA